MRPLRGLSFFALLASSVALTGCPANTCPFTYASPVTITPATACLDAHLDVCVKPSLRIANNCKDALYMPTDYGVFAPGTVKSSEVEVLPGSTITFEVRDDKAKSKTPQRQDYAIPARVASQAVTFTFFVTGEQ